MYTTEEIVFDSSGKLVTDSISKLHLPSTNTVPHRFNVALLKDADTKGNVYSSKVCVYRFMGKPLPQLN